MIVPSRSLRVSGLHHADRSHGRTSIQPAFLECVITCWSSKASPCWGRLRLPTVKFTPLTLCSAPNQTGQRPKNSHPFVFPGRTSCQNPLSSLLGSCTASPAQKGLPEVERARARERERESESMSWEGQRARETQNPKPAPGSELSAETDAGLELTNCEMMTRADVRRLTN